MKSSSICCSTDNCSYTTLSNWTCTNTYNNSLYAKFVCPFSKSVCGLNDTYSLTDIGEIMNISITLNGGDVCFYRINTGCGLAKTDLIKVENSDLILVEYIEFLSSDLVLGSDFSRSADGSPGDGMPTRSEPFNYPNLNKNVFQGRLFFNEGYRIWGTLAQGLDNTDQSEACEDRNTYLVITSHATTKSSLQIGIQTIDISGALYIKNSLIVIVFVFSLLFALSG